MSTTGGLIFGDVKYVGMALRQHSSQSLQKYLNHFKVGFQSTTEACLKQFFGEPDKGPNCFGFDVSFT